MTDIATNLTRVRERVADAARRAGRDERDIRLVAVSKTHPPAVLEEALACGQRAFGENTVQEALGKIPRFADRPIEWHFLGHLQSNKAKFIPAYFHWMHSLDSVRLAERLSRSAQAAGAELSVLIEVNVTEDPRKHGVTPVQLFPLLDQLLAASLPGLRLRGLMTLGPHPAGETEIRRAFATLAALREQARQRYALPEFTELSMGMSGDYVEAIKEGSTMVRIGTAIFGARDYGMDG